MIFTVIDSHNYLSVEHKGEVFKLPRWFCREIGLKPGKWEIQKSEDGILLEPKENDDFFNVSRAGRNLRSICFDKFRDVTGIDVQANPGCYVLKEVK